MGMKQKVYSILSMLIWILQIKEEMLYNEITLWNRNSTKLVFLLQNSALCVLYHFGFFIIHILTDFKYRFSSELYSMKTISDFELQS